MGEVDDRLIVQQSIGAPGGLDVVGLVHGPDKTGHLGLLGPISLTAQTRLLVQRALNCLLLIVAS